MQTNPNEVTTTCYIKANEVTTKLGKLFDFNDSSDDATVIDKFNIL